MSKSKTGNPTPYTIHDEGVIASALDRALMSYDATPAGGGDPMTMKVTAQVEWSGVVDRGRGGVRTTTLDNLRTAGLREAMEKVRRLGDRAEMARPAESYRAKGWHAQLAALTGTPRGSEAADRAGLAPSRRTLLGWLTGSTPSRANQERIAQAYSELRNDRVSRAQANYDRARHELAEKLTGVLKDRYDTEIRLRDITEIKLN